MCGHRRRGSEEHRTQTEQGARGTTARADAREAAGVGPSGPAAWATGGGGPAPDLRVSDAEREQVASALRTHAADGRLDVHELAERLEAAYGARTCADLAALSRDLPPRPTRSADERDQPRRKARPDLRGHLAAFVLVNLLLIAVWAATGAGYFWPVWSLLGWGFGLAKQALAPRWVGWGWRWRAGAGPRRSTS